MDIDVVVAALRAFASCPPDCFIVKQFISILMIITKPHLILWWMCDIVLVQVNQVCGKEEIYSACLQTIPRLLWDNKRESWETVLDLVQKISNAMGREGKWLAIICYQKTVRSYSRFCWDVIHLAISCLSCLMQVQQQFMKKNWPCTNHNWQFWVDPLSSKRVS